MSLLDDFFFRAMFAGIGIAIVAGPFGCMVIWRRLAYFGDTLSHAALLGVALALALEIDTAIGVFLAAATVAIMLYILQRNADISSDALLGILAHASLALGIVVLSLMSWVRFDLSGLLFGDILSVSLTDILVVYGCGVVILLILSLFWRALLATTVNRELAEAEDVAPDRAEIVFMISMALFIAIAIKIVGILLITALLVIPAATARSFATGPEQMAALAAIVGILSVLSGLSASLQWDTPSGPSIVVAALLLFFLSLLTRSFATKDALNE